MVLLGLLVLCRVCFLLLMHLLMLRDFKQTSFQVDEVECGAFEDHIIDRFFLGERGWGMMYGHIGRRQRHHIVEDIGSVRGLALLLLLEKQ